jgi:hypothetical protein
MEQRRFVTSHNSASDLQRYALLAGVASGPLIVFGLVFIVLYVQPRLIGVTEEQLYTYHDQLIWLVVGVGFLLFGAVFLHIAVRWPRRLLWIVSRLHPILWC